MAASLTTFDGAAEGGVEVEPDPPGPEVARLGHAAGSPTGPG